MKDVCSHAVPCCLLCTVKAMTVLRCKTLLSLNYWNIVLFRGVCPSQGISGSFINGSICVMYFKSCFTPLFIHMSPSQAEKWCHLQSNPPWEPCEHFRSYCHAIDFAHPSACDCLLMLTELPESAVVASRAASGLPRSACQPPAADAHADAPGLVQLEQGDELSDMMTARHMSIKER